MRSMFFETVFSPGRGIWGVASPQDASFFLRTFSGSWPSNENLTFFLRLTLMSWIDVKTLFEAGSKLSLRSASRLQSLLQPTRRCWLELLSFIILPLTRESLQSWARNMCPFPRWETRRYCRWSTRDGTCVRGLQSVGPGQTQKAGGENMTWKVKVACKQSHQQWAQCVQ